MDTVLAKFGTLLFRTRVSKFYLFFDFLLPLSSFLKFSLLRLRRRETEYRIGWSSLGSHIQIEDMIDEQVNTAQMEQSTQPREFHVNLTWKPGSIPADYCLSFFSTSRYEFTPCPVNAQSIIPF